MNAFAGEKVFITGAAGFLASNHIRKFLSLSADIYAAVKPGSDLWRIEDLTQSIKIHEIDLTNKDEVKELVQSIRPKWIFHFAASHGENSQQDLFTNNTLCTLNLLHAISGFPLQRFVHYSSSTEYGVSEKPLRELVDEDPLDFYGVSKYACSLICRQYAREKNLPLTILRCFYVYGYYEDPGRLIGTALRASLNGTTVTLTNPEFRRDLIFIDDVVDASLLAAVSNTEPGEVINIGTGVDISNQEFIDLIAGISEKPIAVRKGELPARPHDRHSWKGDIRKAADLLGWTPAHSAREGVNLTIAWMRNHSKTYL